MNTPFGINSASDTGVGATQHGKTGFYSTEHGVGQMLDGAAVGIEPGVVGLVDEPGAAAPGSAPCEIRERVFKANEH